MIAEGGELFSRDLKFYTKFLKIGKKAKANKDIKIPQTTLDIVSNKKDNV